MSLLSTSQITLKKRIGGVCRGLIQRKGTGIGKDFALQSMRSETVFTQRWCVASGLKGKLCFSNAGKVREMRKDLLQPLPERQLHLWINSLRGSIKAVKKIDEQMQQRMNSFMKRQ